MPLNVSTGRHDTSNTYPALHIEVDSIIDTSNTYPALYIEVHSIFINHFMLSKETDIALIYFLAQMGFNIDMISLFPVFKKYMSCTS